MLLFYDVTSFHKLLAMIIIINPYLLRKKFSGITLWPFIILKRIELKEDKVVVNHERIHLRQQAEMLVIFFYLWYGLEFLWRWIQYKNRYKAYLNISFEREAYRNEKTLDYLETRPVYSFRNYL